MESLCLFKNLRCSPFLCSFLEIHRTTSQVPIWIILRNNCFRPQVLLTGNSSVWMPIFSSLCPMRLTLDHTLTNTQRDTGDRRARIVYDKELWFLDISLSHRRSYRAHLTNPPHCIAEQIQQFTSSTEPGSSSTYSRNWTPSGSKKSSKLHIDKIQMIPTRVALTNQQGSRFSAIDWEFFTVGPDSYLIVSNAQQHLDSSSPLSYFTGTAHSYTGTEVYQPPFCFRTAPQLPDRWHKQPNLHQQPRTVCVTGRSGNWGL